LASSVTLKSKIDGMTMSGSAPSGAAHRPLCFEFHILWLGWNAAAKDAIDTCSRKDTTATAKKKLLRLSTIVARCTIFPCLAPSRSYFG
jgi:hypothetical protein